MSAQHTPGRLNVAVEIFDNDGCPETAIQGLDAAATAGLVRQREELLEALKLAHGALRQAAADVNDWGAYAPAHFQAKHKLADDVQAYSNAADSARAAIAKAQGEA